MKDDRVYIRHILRCISRIEEYLAHGGGAMSSSSLVQDAVLNPVIDEIREVRHQISEECGHDPARLVAYFVELQKQYPDRLLPAPATDDRADRPAA